MNATFLEDAASSDSDSGWTLYLQHSPSPPPPPTNNNNYYRKKNKINKINRAGSYSRTEEGEGKEEEEDSSMVSDASSGPPHFNLNDVGYGYGYGGERNNERIEINPKCNISKKAKDFAHLDDTASSPNLFLSPKMKNNEEVSNSSLKSLIDYSNSPAFSANHFQERSTNLQGPYDHEFLQSSLHTDRFQQNQWF